MLFKRDISICGILICHPMISTSINCNTNCSRTTCRLDTYFCKRRRIITISNIRIRSLVSKVTRLLRRNTRHIVSIYSNRYFPTIIIGYIIHLNTTCPCTTNFVGIHQNKSRRPTNLLVLIICNVRYIICVNSYISPQICETTWVFTNVCHNSGVS